MIPGVGPPPGWHPLISGVPVTENSWWEKQPIFAALNTNKKDITLDLPPRRDGNC